MSAPRLTIRVQLQQDHGFSRPLFRKPQRRRWPWLMLLLLLAVGVALLQQPQWLQRLSAALPKAPEAPVPSLVVAPSSQRQSGAVTAPPAAVAPKVKAALANETVAAEPAPQQTVPTPAVPDTVPEAAAVAAVAATVAEPAAAPVPVAAPAAAAAVVQPVSAPSQVADTPAAATGPRVSRQLLTAAINAREPVGQLGDTLQAPAVVYFFNELTAMQGSTISHRWYHDGQLIKERFINVGAVRWRTWSRHEIDGRSTGLWRVELVDGSGKQLASQQWQVTGSVP